LKTANDASVSQGGKNKVRIIPAGLAVFFFTVVGFGQTTQSPPPRQPPEFQQVFSPQISGLPVIRRVKPKLSLQAALKIAESYVKAKKFDTSILYLSEVRLIEYGPEKGPKERRWLFLWAHPNAVGLFNQITVSMDGKVAQHASL
jgi:hypothetical protein